MSTMKHTKEPWFSFASGHCIGGPLDYPGELKTAGIAMYNMERRSPEENRANAMRAITCVNACAGIEDPANAVQDAREAISLAIRTIEQLIPERSARGVAEVVLCSLRAAKVAMLPAS